MDQQADEHLVVLYYYVTDEEGFVRITPRLFARHLDYFRREGYVPCTVRDLVHWLRGERSLTKRTLCINFDDGLRCQHAEAFPLLRAASYTGCFFMSTNNVTNGRVLNVHRIHLLLRHHPVEVVGEAFTALTGISVPTDIRLNPRKRWDSAYVANLKFLLHQSQDVLDELFCGFFTEEKDEASRLYFGFEEAKELLAAGMDFGGHTMNHVFLAGLSERRQREELPGSKSVLEQNIGRPVDLLSYPSGSFDETTIAIARELCFVGGLTVRTAENTGTTDPFRINRLDANHITERLRQEEKDGR